MLLTDNDGQSVNFQIPEEYKKILVNVSGGVDSALALYLTVKYIKNNNLDVEINAMTCANSAKGNWNARKAADVIHTVITRTGYTNFNMHYSFYRDEQEGHYFEQVQKQLLANGIFDFFIHGTTANPGPVIVKNIRGRPVNLAKDALPDRDLKNYDVLSRKTVNGKTFGLMSPWYNVNKKFIAAQYKKFNLLDDLLPLTRSCENRPAKPVIIDQFETEPCGKCWWCLEKKWAFGHF